MAAATVKKSKTVYQSKGRWQKKNCGTCEKESLPRKLNDKVSRHGERHEEDRTKHTVLRDPKQRISGFVGAMFVQGINTTRLTEIRARINTDSREYMAPECLQCITMCL